MSFNTLNRKTGNRLKQNLVDLVSGEPVDTADRVKGYQVAKGQYVMVEDADLEALKIESTKLIEIETFVPQSEIDQIYLDSPYYLAPDDKVAEEAFAVIREAMTRKKMVGIGRVVLSRRERMLMLQPRGKGMLATTLRYPYEVRQDAEYFEGITEIELPAAMLDIAQEIIGRMSGHFEPETIHRPLRGSVVSHAERQAGGPDLRGARGAGTGQRRQHHGRAEAQPRGRRWGAMPRAAARAEQAAAGPLQWRSRASPGHARPVRGPRCRRG